MAPEHVEVESELTARSVSRLLAKARCQDEQAIAELWQRYWKSLVELAQSRCQYTTALVDPEFIAQSVFQQVCDKFRSGDLDAIDNRDKFWAVLLNLTKNRAIDHFRRETRKKRGAGQRVSLSDGQQEAILDQASIIPIDANIEAKELLEQLCGKLRREDPTRLLEKLLLARLGGRQVSELAEEHEVSSRTIERKLERIRLVFALIAQTSDD